jgi:hypothetical protein
MTLIAYNMIPPTILGYCGKVFTEPFPSEIKGYRDHHKFLFYKGAIQNDKSNNSSTYACTSCRVDLSSRKFRMIHLYIGTGKGRNKYSVEMGSGAVIFVHSFTKHDSEIQMLIWEDM